MRETRTEKNYISKDAFRRWVRAMYDQFMESYAVVQTYKNYTYVYLRSKVGVAKCNSTDEWNDRIGIAYAWARCTGQPVYYEKEEKYIPRTGDRVSIKFINSRNYFWTFVAEGVDNYCFKRGDGHLDCYYKDSIKSIMKAE